MVVVYSTAFLSVALFTSF